MVAMLVYQRVYLASKWHHVVNPMINHRQSCHKWVVKIIPTGRTIFGFTSLYQELYIIIYLQCEAPKIAKLVYNSNNYGLWYL